MIQESKNIRSLKTVSIGKRFIHFIIDHLLLISFWFALVFIVSEFSIYNIAFIMYKYPHLCSVGSAIIYYTLCEYIFGKTLGKLITKSIVINENGNKPSFGKILLRTLIRYVPFEAISVLNNGIMWHDSWTKTFVVKTESIQDNK